MAPQKRRRDGDNVEQEVIAVESASSSLRREGHRKKARISNLKAQEAGEESDSDETEEDGSLPDADEEDEQQLHPSTQYEELRDGGFAHLNNEERDDEIATQRFLTRKQQIGENHAAENSIIQEITCINFMCHDKLHVELGPLINFIVGMNGSGKSAVLTAITLCLAGKTGSTDRGSAMKHFVKSGKDQGLLIVKLKNQGQDAYQPDVFGDKIIVERHFSKTGSGGYKLKNETGRVISTKKADIEDIVEYFQLQVDNPMTVLTQDKAKSFLTKSTPKQKYDFFVDGVQLSTLDSDYKMISETCDTLATKLQDWEQSKKILKKKAEIAKAKADMVQKHEATRREARRIRNQLAWAQVESLETKLEAKQALVLSAQAEIDQQQGIVEHKDEEFQRIDRLLEQVREAETNVRAEAEPLVQDQEAAKAEYDASHQDIVQHKAEGLNIANALKASQKKVKTIKIAIKEEEKRLEDVNGGSHARKKAAIEEAKIAAIDAKAALLESQQELPRLEESRNLLQAESGKVDNALKSKKREVDEARSLLDQLNNDRGNVMAGFDPNMPRLLQMIRSDTGFQEKPIGPMGLNIRLLKPVWADILEKTMGGNLGGFVVTCKADQLRLSALIRQAGIRINTPVLIGNNRPIDTSSHEPDPKFDTILRVLEIDNELVKKTLIIAHGIEQSILIEDIVDAERAMYDGIRPRNVKQCLVINKDNRGWGFRLAHGGRGGQDRDLTPIQKFQGHSRLRTNIESQIQSRQATLNLLREELSDLETGRRTALLDVKNATQAINRQMRTIDGLRIDSQRAEDKVEVLQVDLDRDIVEDGRLELLNDELKEAEQAIVIDEETYGNHALEKGKLNQISLDKKRALETVKALVSDHDAKISKAHTKTRNTEQARNLHLKDKNAAIDRIQELHQQKAALEERRDAQASQTAHWAEEATKVCERVPIDIGQNPSSLEIKFKKLKQQLDAYAKQQGGSDAEIQNAAADAQLAYENAESTHADITELHELLKQSFVKRIGMYRKFQQFISARSRINFNYLLSERAFRGKLSIDHKAKKLDVHVEPDETNRSSKGRQTKTLSGGEKSFSNICLLLSLWEAMGQPLRCLDEFDVFMDDVNRDVSTSMIISAARRSVGRQFILITPKGLGNGIDADADVKMIKLTDPRDKSQRRIDDMMNGEDE